MPSHNSNLVFFKNLTACFYCFTLFGKVKIKVLFVQIFGVKQTKKTHLLCIPSLRACRANREHVFALTTLKYGRLTDL